MLFLPSRQLMGSYKQTFPKAVAALLFRLLAVQSAAALALTREMHVGRMEVLNRSEKAKK